MKTLRLFLVCLSIAVISTSAMAGSWQWTVRATSDGALGATTNTKTIINRCHVTCAAAHCWWAIKQNAVSHTVYSGLLFDTPVTTVASPYSFVTPDATTGKVLASGGYFDTLTGTTTHSCLIWK